MSLMLSIDPGVRGVGVGLWLDKKLIAAAYVKSSEETGHGPREAAMAARAVADWLDPAAIGARAIVDLPGSKAIVDTLVLEWPQIYARGGGKTKGDPNVLLPLAGVDAALAALFPNTQVTHYTPHDWKGGIEKPKSAAAPYIIESRVLSRLDEKEKAAIKWPNAKKFTWDVSDAVGVGLKYLGRFDRQRVFHRE